MDIDEIALHLKDGEKRHNEVFLTKPFKDKRLFTLPQKPLAHSWLLKIRSSLIKLFLPALSKEAEFKTEVALLLSHPYLYEHFIEDAKRRSKFFHSLKAAASELKIPNFCSPPMNLSPQESCQWITEIEGESLLESPHRLDFYRQRIDDSKRLLLHRILSHIERDPFASNLELTPSRGSPKKVMHTTLHGRCRVNHIDAVGNLDYCIDSYRAEPSFEQKNLSNQRVVIGQLDDGDPYFVGSYCSSLSTSTQVIEQLLFLLDAQEEAKICENQEGEPLTLLFSSMFNWKEMEEICQQRDAIRALDGKSLVIGERSWKLNLLYMNLNTIYRLPIPAEMRGFLEDINDECLIRLLQISPYCEALKELPSDFFQRQKHALEIIDSYRRERKKLASQTPDASERAVILKQRGDGKPFEGMDLFCYLDKICKSRGILHNKNCKSGIDRSSSAKAFDKAQSVFSAVMQGSYLRGENDDLFKTVYSLYLIYEEAEINSALTTGHYGPSFFKRLLYQNPQQEDYLTRWAKSIPTL